MPHLSRAQSGALPRIASGFIVPMCPLHPFHILSSTFDIFPVYQKGPFPISLLTYVTSSSNSHVFPKEMNKVVLALSLCHSQCHCSCSMIEEVVLMLACGFDQTGYLQKKQPWPYCRTSGLNGKGETLYCSLSSMFRTFILN